MLRKMAVWKNYSRQTTPANQPGRLSAFNQWGLLISSLFDLGFIVMSLITGSDFWFWLALSFGLLLLGLGVGFGLLRLAYYRVALYPMLAGLLVCAGTLVWGAGISSAALTFLLADLLITLLLTLLPAFSNSHALQQSISQPSDMMIKLGRQEGELEVMQATLNSLEEGLLLTDAQDKVLRANRRLNTLFGLRSEAEKEGSKPAAEPRYSSVLEWMNRVRAVATNPEDFKSAFMNARELVRRGESSEFVFGVEKPNSRYRDRPQATEKALPEASPADGSYGRFEPLFPLHTPEDEQDTLFERDSRLLLYCEIKLTVFPVLATKGNLLGVCYLLRDVTDEREVEQIKENFISIVSHEVRTPMAVILGLTELLGLPDTKPEEHAEWLTAINEEALRLRTVLNDLQSISRIQDGALELQLEEIELGELIERVAKVSQMQYRSNHKIVTTFELEQTTIYSDRGKVTQVLTNLIGNAVKYTPETGEIRLRIGLRPKHPDQIYISVTDQGIGIPKHEQHKIFSRFFRSSNTRQKGIGGTGLGLAISQHLVKLMGGAVWFESEENQGSTFYFSLPLLTAETAMLDDPEYARIEGSHPQK